MNPKFKVTLEQVEAPEKASAFVKFIAKVMNHIAWNIYVVKRKLNETYVECWIKVYRIAFGVQNLIMWLILWLMVSRTFDPSSQSVLVSASFVNAALMTIILIASALSTKQPRNT